MLEEARGLGELLKQGWKPKRTIIYCAWDGEEPGLLGSTEWVETHGAELREHAAVYINTDSNGRGFLSAEGSHSLEKFINDVARDIVDPETKLTVWKRAQLRAIIEAPSKKERKEIRKRADLRIGALGSGSDWAAFLDHEGIASLNLGYYGESGGGIYHSIYDDFYWYTHFSDTNFVYGRALAQTGGTAVMRFADADLLPYEFTDFADTIHKYVEELKKLLKDKQEFTEERNRELEEGALTAAADPKKTFVPPPKEEIPPHLNFAPLENAADALTRSAEDYEKALAQTQKDGAWDVSQASLNKVNAMLIQSERKLTSPQGLKGRSWYRHMIYAPGAYTGYSVKTIPGVRESIEQKQWKQAEEEIVRAAGAIQAEADWIHSAAADLEHATDRK
jgi:N-acetylated-alpha-linked acidic dipeptidase